MNNIDEIICISLDISKDRREHFKKHFENIPYRFNLVKKHKKGGVYGCFHSHISIIKDAYKRNLENILIFEDDAKPTSSLTNESLEEVINFLKSNKDYDCFYLGCFPIGAKNNNLLITPFNSISKNIYKFNPLATHAIIYNRRGMKKVLKNYKNFIGLCHYDIYLSRYANLNNYCYLPILIDQNFNFEYNIEYLNILEFIIRKSYPILEFFKLNYNISFIIFKIYLLINKYVFSFSI